MQFLNVLKSVHKEEGDEKSKTPNDFVNRIYSEIDLSSQSKFSSSSEFEFLSSTDLSEEGLSEREVRKHTEPDLLVPIPEPESQLEEVQKLWGQTVRDSLDNILTEFDDLFMKHKADIGRCKNAKHTVEVEPGATPHREGARRMSCEKAERANQEVRNLSDLDHDPTLAVTLGKWDRDGQEEEWGVAFLLRLSPPQRIDHKRRVSPSAH